MISEKCVLILKSGKFHIDLSFGLAEQCNREKRKPLNVQRSTAMEPERCSEEKTRVGRKDKTGIIRCRGDNTQRRQRMKIISKSCGYF